MTLCLQAWGDLNTCRSIGMAAGPIPWTAIADWTRFHELERDVAGAVLHVIRQLDIDHMKAAASERNKREALGANRARGRT